MRVSRLCTWAKVNGKKGRERAWHVLHFAEKRQSDNDAGGIQRPEEGSCEIAEKQTGKKMQNGKGHSCGLRRNAVRRGLGNKPMAHRPAEGSEEKRRKADTAYEQDGLGGGLGS